MRIFAMPRLVRALVCALPIVLTACGGGGSDGGCPSTAASGGTADRQDWLRCYFGDNYFWYRLSQSPSPVSYVTVGDYFDALLYRGGDPIPNGGGTLWPSDRYSGFQSTASFNTFFQNGQTLGYGVAVNGLEASEQAATRLFVRYVEPQSPAALTNAIAGGLKRGDELLTINDTPVATLISANGGLGDYSALTAKSAGSPLRLEVRRGASPVVPLTLNASVFSLTPVQIDQVVVSPVNRTLMGYVFVKDMINQVEPSLSTVMADFRARGIRELVLDLRYNGGGLVTMGRNVASYASGAPASGQIYARLLHNDRNSGLNQDFQFTNPGGWNGFTRVYVLSGPRTCSASEQVINGLRGVGVNVVSVGDTTCGKPVGFNPVDDGWGTTYSVVNFEGVNARNEGRYFTGLLASCPVAEDLTRPIGDLADPLLVAAAYAVDNNGACPIALAREAPQSRRAGAAPQRYNGADGGERTGMTAR
jgi:carboxyl-terminal processing protease